MPKLKALYTLALEGERVRAGETFEVKDEIQAAELVKGGSAKEVKAESDPKPKTK